MACFSISRYRIKPGMAFKSYKYHPRPPQHRLWLLLWPNNSPSDHYSVDLTAFAISRTASVTVGHLKMFCWTSKIQQDLILHNIFEHLHNTYMNPQSQLKNFLHFCFCKAVAVLQSLFHVLLICPFWHVQVLSQHEQCLTAAHNDLQVRTLKLDKSSE